MAISVILPALDVTQESGKLLAWKKKAGDRVSKGETLFEVETDKAVVEVEAPGDGILAGILADEGAVVAFGRTVAWLVQEGEAVPNESAEFVEQTTSHGLAVSVAIAGAPQPALADRSKRISPKARRLAAELGIDLAKLRGSGPEGEVLAEDVLAHKAPRDATGSANGGAIEELSGAARIAAERTAQGWSTIPHFFVSRELEAGALVAARDELAPAIEKQHGVKPSLNDLLVALTARVLMKHPRVNARWVQGSVHHNVDVNMGVAIAVGDSVVAGVIRKAQELDLAAIANRRKALAERAQAGRLQPDDISGISFTLSNLGMFSVDSFTAIIVPPQVAILAVGQVRDRVVAKEGMPVVRPMMNVTLSLDHRVGGGRTAALFLADLAEAVANPEKWL